MPNIWVPEGFSYVAAGFLSTWVLQLYQFVLVARYRRAADIKYPQMYAEKAEVEKSVAALKFNCMQRAHQNTLESIPTVYLGTILTALQFPKIAAFLITFWSVNRVIYTQGYITGDPAKRTRGGLGLVCQVALLLLSVYTVVPMVLAEI